MATCFRGSGAFNTKFIFRWYLKVEVKETMVPTTSSQLIRFLEEDLSISTSSIAIALRHLENDPGPLPMILWQYGLVTIEQLEQFL